MNNSALYYPYMVFNSASWLKSMAMFYENIYRIVPNGIIPEDHEELQPLLEDGAIGRMIDPSQYSHGAADKFLNKISNWHAAALSHNENDKQKITRIHRDKTDERIRMLFDSLGYGESQEWIDVPTDLASNYMLYLANEIGYANRLDLITNELAPWTATNYFNMNGGLDDFIAPYGKGAENPFGLFCLTVSEICPININEIPAEDIVNFRYKRRDEIDAFKKSLNDLCLSLNGVEDDVVYYDELEKLVGLVKKAHADYKQSADIIRAGGFCGFLLQGFPGALALANVLKLEPEVMTILFGTALAVGGLYNYSKSKNDLKLLRHNNSFSVLADIEEDFSNYTSRRGGGDVNFAAYNSMEEYVND
ncbi:DUF6236 family protein [Desulfovibrio sp. DV]|uniref:DUF6236 family protein n=1 Tax=Desulfovibrio sp. DV TaxID=1844708 RepID=UPI000AB6023E|nr:DUF6236 family protein [Desulfovibrio sp. DV]